MGRTADLGESSPGLRKEMTPEQIEKARVLQKRLLELEKDLDAFVTELDPAQSDHPCWQVWQPVSTAEGRLNALINLGVAKQEAANV